LYGAFTAGQVIAAFFAPLRSPREILCPQTIVACGVHSETVVAAFFASLRSLREIFIGQHHGRLNSGN